MVELVSEERQATRENVERKQARTSDELEEEEDDAGGDESDEEEEQVLYNPKNLPLGERENRSLLCLLIANHSP